MHHPLHGEAYRTALPVLWFDDRGLDGPSDSVWRRYDNEDKDTRLGSAYGLINAVPLTDQLGRNCVGVLAVHVGPEASQAVRALGAVSSPEGRRRLNNASIELNGFVGHQRRTRSHRV